jgi:cysteine desulfurase/selenocysteine lyase
MFDVNEVRRLFPHTKKKVYFNCASTGPLPDPAYSIQDKYYRIARMAAVGDQSEVFSALENIRRNGAKLFGAKKSEIGFGLNTTFGLNLAAFGLPLKRGDEVLISDVEFPANAYPWLALRERGIQIKFIKTSNGFVTVEDIERAITKKTRALSLSYVQYFNGYKIDVEGIGDICRKRKIYFVMDCIQGAGCEPMNMRKWNVAVASAGAQKWLLSSQGTGLFYVSDDVRHRIQTPWRSWLSIDWKCRWDDLRRFNLEPPDAAQRYELGTYPGTLVMAFDWVLGYITGLGVRAIQKHNHALLDSLIAFIENHSSYRITSSLDTKHRSSILSFTSDGADIGKIHAALHRRNINTSLREGSIRVSAHLYNDQSDMDQLISALDAKAEKSRKDRP